MCPASSIHTLDRRHTAGEGTGTYGSRATAGPRAGLWPDARFSDAARAVLILLAVLAVFAVLYTVAGTGWLPSGDNPSYGSRWDAYYNYYSGLPAADEMPQAPAGK